MNPIRMSRVAPVAAEMGMHGVQEWAYLLRLLLQKKSNSEIRNSMARTFGRRWANAGLEKQYFELLCSYVLFHHEREFFAYLRATDPNDNADQMKILRSHLVRYLADMQGIVGRSQVVDDLA